MPFSNTSEHSVLASRQSQNHFLMLPINRKLSQKTVSTSPLRNLQKGEKCHFQTIRTFVFDLDVASKPFSKLLRTAQFKFKPSSRFLNHFLKYFPRQTLNSNHFQGFALLSQIMVSILSIKSLQKRKNVIFEPSLHSLLTSRQLQNHFLKCFS